MFNILFICQIWLRVFSVISKCSLLFSALVRCVSLCCDCFNVCDIGCGVSYFLPLYIRWVYNVWLLFVIYMGVQFFSIFYDFFDWFDIYWKVCLIFFLLDMYVWNVLWIYWLFWFSAADTVDFWVICSFG